MLCVDGARGGHVEARTVVCAGPKMVSLTWGDSGLAYTGEGPGRSVRWVQHEKNASELLILHELELGCMVRGLEKKLD